MRHGKVLLVVMAAVLLAFGVSCGKGGDHDHGSGKEASRVEVLYTCPMHPEVVSKNPNDRCPKCHMALVPQKETPEPPGGMTQSGTGMHGHGKNPSNKTAAPPERKALYYCPMHTTYTSDRPGECPICGMDLVPAARSEDLASTVPGQAAVRVDTARRQMIGVVTSNVEKRAIVKAIRTSGWVAYDPELFEAQEEYISALNAYEKAQKGASPEVVERAKSLVESSRLRLKIIGLSDAQVDALSTRGGPDSNLLIGTKGGKAWLYADIYEYEFGRIHAGQEVEAVSLAYQGRVFKGKVAAIDTVVNPRTRSARIRARLSDPDGLLKPDMFMNVKILMPVGTGLAVPEEAVMFTGTRSIVFVDKGDGILEPREVRLGARGEDHYEVKSGLQEGEKVVTSGNFLVDSESKLKSALSRMSPQGHSH